jgi:hypothetical protein
MDKSHASDEIDWALIPLGGIVTSVNVEENLFPDINAADNPADIENGDGVGREHPGGYRYAADK